MIRKPSRLDAKRLAVGSLVAATSFTGLGVAFASSADATATAITATPAQTSYPTTSTATINVSYTGTPTHTVRYSIDSGPDAGQTTAINSAVNANNTVTIKNNGTAGTDKVTVYEDVDGNGTLTTGDISTSTSVTFAGAVSSFTTAKSSATVPVGVDETYSIAAVDSAGNPAVGRDISYKFSKNFTSASATTPTSGGPLTVTSPTSPTPASAYAYVSGPDANGVYTYSQTVTGTTTTAATTSSTAGTTAGTAKVSVQSSKTGTVAAQFTNAAGTYTTNDSFTVVGGNTGNAAVTNIKASATTTSANTGKSVTYTVNATDSSNNPVSGATVSYLVTSGPDKNQTSINTLSTNASGNATVVITNSGTAGTDAVTFYVNQTTQAVVTDGPDSGEPQTTGSATFTTPAAPPVFTGFRITCPDQAIDPSTGSVYTADESCTVPSGTASTTFTVKAYNVTKNANGVSTEVGVAGATVALKVASGTATLSATSVTTGSDGTATVTATPSTTTAGTTYTVEADTNASNGVGGTTPKTDSAVVTYQAPTASNIVLAPASQNATVGGTVSVKATVLTQFGGALPSSALPYTITFTASADSRNAAQFVNKTFAVNADGTYTLTYTDAVTASTPTTDTISATGSNGATSNTATVNFLASTTVSTVKLNLAEGNTAKAPSGPTQTDNVTSEPTASSLSYPAYTVSNNTQVTVDAIGYNSAGQPVPGAASSISVDKGFVTADGTSGATTAPTSTSISGNASTLGAFVGRVGSTVAGTQTITATIGGVSATGTVKYIAGDAASVTLSPSTPVITAGSSQVFTATAKDQFGNPEVGSTLTFNVTGSGTINGSSSAQGFTGADGTTSVTVSVPSTGTTGGSVSVADQSGHSATTTYTVKSGTTSTAPANIAVSGLTSVVVRNVETATATVTDSSGKTVADGTVVNFATSGTQSDTGTATTVNGVASFTFRTLHAGQVAVTATSGDATGTQAVLITRQPTTFTVGGYSNAKGVATLVALPSSQSQVVIDSTVHFYQSSGNGYVGPVPVKVVRDSSGKARAQIDLKRTSGVTYTFYATIEGNPDVVATPSKLFSVKVK